MIINKKQYQTTYRCQQSRLKQATCKLLIKNLYLLKSVCFKINKKLVTLEFIQLKKLKNLFGDYDKLKHLTNVARN